jgi:hypothetical protein
LDCRRAGLMGADVQVKCHLESSPLASLS